MGELHGEPINQISHMDTPDRAVMTWSYPKRCKSHRPMVTVRLDGQKIWALIDSGADSSYISKSALLQLCPTARFCDIPSPFTIVPFYDPDTPGSKTTSQGYQPMVSQCVVLQLQFLAFDFKHLIMCYDGASPTLLLGLDIIKCMGLLPHASDLKLLINPHTSAIRPQLLRHVDGRLDQEGFVRQLNVYMTNRAKYKQMKLVNPAAFKDLPPDRDDYSEECFQVSALEETNSSTLIKGIEVNPDDIPLYPIRSMSLDKNQRINMPCHAGEFSFKAGRKYLIRPAHHISRGNLEFIDHREILYSPERPVEHLIKLPLTTSTWAQLDKEFICAIVTPIKVERVSAVTYSHMYPEDEIPNYPEFSSFEPITYHPDLPLPLTTEILKSVRDYTREEWDALEPLRSKLLCTENDKLFMTPKPGVFIPVEDPQDTEDSYLMLSKQLSELPDGCWFQERPDELPGVPMIDVAIRVRVKVTDPIAVKMRRMSSEEFEIAKKQLLEEIKLGLWEPSNSPWAQNLTWAPKPDGSLRLCIDFRRVNEVTVKDKYPLPRMEDILLNISGKQFISLIDLTKGFNNLFIHPADRAILAFITPVGLLQPIRLPFGWANGPAICQREVDRTLGSLSLVFRGYVDDISGGTVNNQRLHDLVLATVLFNFHRRGFRFHAKKAQLLAEWLKLVGRAVSTNGTRPLPAPGLWDTLLARDHKDLRDVQKTLGSLQWFHNFIPNFSYTVQHLSKLLRSENRHGNKINFTDECRQAILSVKEIIEKLPLHAHASVEAEKEIFIAHGNLAFAVSLYQKSPHGPRDILQFWSKRWCNDVTNYTTAEKLALCIRETIRHFQPLLTGSPSLTIYTNDPVFAELAREPSTWSPRMHKYLSHTIQFAPKFLRVPIKYQKDLDLLSDPIPLIEQKPPTLNYSQEQLLEFFQPLPENQVQQIPVVQTDGGCIRENAQRKGAIGVFWGPTSSFNVSRLAERPPFTNQRAELEAVLVAVQQARKRGFEHLILLSDSAYAVNCLTEHRKHWTMSETTDRIDKMIIDQKGQIPKNGDLFRDILRTMEDTPSIQVYFRHVRRAQNTEADFLVNDAFRRGGIPLSTAMTVITRSQLSKSEGESQKDMDNIPPWNPENSLENQEEDSDDVVVWLSDNESDNDAERDRSIQEEQERLEVQLSKIPEQEVEDVPSEISDDEILPDISGLPSWTSHLNYPEIPSKKQVSPIMKLGAPHLRELLSITSSIPEAQNKDKILGDIKEALKGSSEASTSFINGKKSHHYVLDQKDNVLLAILKDGQQRIIVPESLKLAITQLFHASPVLGGHARARSTLTHIRRYFTWTGMAAYVESYCQNCSVCIAGRNRQGKPPGFMTPMSWPSGPFHRVHADTMRSLPKANGYQHVLVIVDSFSKFVFTHPLRSGYPKYVIEALTIIFTKFGQPGLFVSDNGGEFHNKELTDFLKLWGVSYRFTAPYNPQANGQAEAAVKIISNKLRLAVMDLCESTESHPERRKAEMKWPLLLPYVTMAYNRCPNEVTGFSPFELVFGKPAPIPTTFDINRLDKYPYYQEGLGDYLHTLQKGLRHAYDIVNDRTKIRRKHVKAMYDKHRTRLKIDEGDFVYITLPYGKKLRKFDNRATGPYRVASVRKTPDNEDVVSISVWVPNKNGHTVRRWYPRHRIRPIQAALPKVNWKHIQECNSTIDASKVIEDSLGAEVQDMYQPEPFFDGNSFISDNLNSNYTNNSQSLCKFRK